jgi:hypothetical protein
MLSAAFILGLLMVIAIITLVIAGATLVVKLIASKPVSIPRYLVMAIVCVVVFAASGIVLISGASRFVFGEADESGQREGGLLSKTMEHTASEVMHGAAGIDADMRANALKVASQLKLTPTDVAVDGERATVTVIVENPTGQAVNLELVVASQAILLTDADGISYVPTDAQDIAAIPAGEKMRRRIVYDITTADPETPLTHLKVGPSLVPIRGQ